MNNLIELVQVAFLLIGFAFALHSIYKQSNEIAELKKRVLQKEQALRDLGKLLEAETKCDFCGGSGELWQIKDTDRKYVCEVCGGLGKASAQKAEH